MLSPLTSTALRVLFAFVWLIAPLSALFVASVLYLHASPLVLLPTRYALPAPVATALGWFCVVESLWLVVHTVGREAVRRGYWELHKETVVLGEEERWRLWTRMCERAEDPCKFLTRLLPVLTVRDLAWWVLLDGRYVEASAEWSRGQRDHFRRDGHRRERQHQGGTSHIS